MSPKELQGASCAERLIKNRKVPLKSFGFEISHSGGATHIALLTLRALDSASLGSKIPSTLHFLC